MAHFKFRNINDAFRGLVEGVFTGRIPTYVQASRYGEVAQVEEPVIITYERPVERVLFNSARDSNPFFHLYEGLYFLAGRNDVEPLAYYNKRMSEFSDDGKVFNGSYGYRWCSAKADDVSNWNSGDGLDQLEVIIDHLRRKPESRRAVLQMWTVEDDLLKIDESKDVCCNTCVYFAVRQGVGERPQYLDMTVCNRSNDMIWGMLGANAVHMAVLQEYLAAHLGLEVGVYNQFTNNLHVYTKNWEPQKWLTEYNHDFTGGHLEYPATFPLVRDPAVFDAEVGPFVEVNKNGEEVTQYTAWKEPFLNEVAQPLCHAFHIYKQKDYDAALVWASRIKAADWGRAATEWLERRAARARNRVSAGVQ